jgi:Zn-dependent M28 family amino/carboxypeptidase
MFSQKNLFPLSLAGLACALGVGAVAALAQPAKPTPLAQLPDIDQKTLLRGIEILASDRFEGRLPGTKGEELTVNYLIDELKALGLAPGNTDGTFIQRVPLVGLTPSPTSDLRFSKGGEWRPLKWREDYVAWTTRVVPTVGLDESEIVFVGYGVEAPEFDWDDYKGLDVSGKTLVMLVNDPPVPDPADPSKLDPTVFGGRAMTYYGRWTYKYEIGAEKKAAGVLIVHETGPAGYPWGVVKGFSDERFNLRTPDKNAGRVAVEGWISLDAARQLFAAAGHDFESLRSAAATRAFKPVSLGMTASISLQNGLRNVDSRNVLAKIEGSDPAKKDEVVVYSAHWDHLGVGEAVSGDRIYNGAVDNATGTSGLIEIARAFTKLGRAPSRTIVFLAVTAEEQGLLGAQYYAEHPIYPLEKTLANINMDGLGVHGRTKDITVIGLGNSDLDDYLRDAAAEQGRRLAPDPEPEKGFYYRSDHFNFARKGVPAPYTDEGVDFIDQPPGFSQQIRDDYTTNRYHKPQDEVLPTWDLSGAAEDLKLLFGVGLRVAEAEKWPEWKEGNEFKGIRGVGGK